VKVAELPPVVLELEGDLEIVEQEAGWVESTVHVGGEALVELIGRALGYPEIDSPTVGRCRLRIEIWPEPPA
jgi:hypothetical protein